MNITNISKNQKPLIGIIDYGIGNRISISRAFEHLGCKVKICPEIGSVKECDGIILPGVGSFGMASAHMKNSGLNKEIKKHVSNDKALLGICLGMQLLGSRSEEAKTENGLNIIEGQTFKLPTIKKETGRQSSLHVGWVKTNSTQTSTNKHCLNLNSHNFYYVHGYYFQPNTAETLHYTYKWGNQNYAAVVKDKKTWGVQFHPEKSAGSGLNFLNSFISSI